MINDSRQLAYPKLKEFFDIVFLIGAVLLVIKLVVILLNKVAGWDLSLYGGSFLWNFGPLILMVGGGIGAGMVKEKYKQD